MKGCTVNSLTDADWVRAANASEQWQRRTDIRCDVWVAPNKTKSPAAAAANFEGGNKRAQRAFQAVREDGIIPPLRAAFLQLEEVYPNHQLAIDQGLGFHVGQAFLAQCSAGRG